MNATYTVHRTDPSAIPRTRCREQWAETAGRDRGCVRNRGSMVARWRSVVGADDADRLNPAGVCGRLGLAVLWRAV
jgi:hypothetical protein